MITCTFGLVLKLIASIIGLFIVSVRVGCATFLQPSSVLDIGMQHGGSDNVSVIRTDPKKVKVEFYMESLCIDCQRFMLEQLHPAYALLGDSVMDLTIVPYGNAKIDTAKKQVTCQHGAAECDANSFEQCAIQLYPYASRYLPFIYCLDQSLSMGYDDKLIPRSLFAECARESAMDFSVIAACHDDVKQAWRLQRKAAKATPKEHKYVPWVVIDGQHAMDEDKDSFLNIVCQAYQANGGHHAACQDKTAHGAVSTVK
ncbi:oxidoreductase [Mayamaea pseudoterrestris]|nr:oxidoreductase [Mayamaea pseudoterrestris]